MPAAYKQAVKLGVPLLALILLASWGGIWQWFLAPVYPGLEEYLYSRIGLWQLIWQRLCQVEFPLALPLIMTGIKISVVINIGTATIGATIGAGGLGAPIITGLASDNPAFILQGSVLAALFAIIADFALELVENTVGTFLASAEED